MLKERSPLAIGSVAVAFDAVCPTRLDLLHQQYRRLCRMLPDADEWGQVDLMNLLLRYARTMLPRPTGDELDPDVMLLLSSVEPILMSCNPAVSLLLFRQSIYPIFNDFSQSAMAAARAIFYAGPPVYLQKIVQPLLRLLHSSKEIERIVLVYLSIVAQKSPVGHNFFYSTVKLIFWFRNYYPLTILVFFSRRVTPTRQSATRFDYYSES